MAVFRSTNSHTNLLDWIIPNARTGAPLITISLDDLATLSAHALRSHISTLME